MPCSSCVAIDHAPSYYKSNPESLINNDAFYRSRRPGCHGGWVRRLYLKFPAGCSAQRGFNQVTIDPASNKTTQGRSVSSGRARRIPGYRRTSRMYEKQGLVWLFFMLRTHMRRGAVSVTTEKGLPDHRRVYTYFAAACLCNHPPNLRGT